MADGLQAFLGQHWFQTKNPDWAGFDIVCGLAYIMIGAIETADDDNAGSHFRAPDGFIYELSYDPTHLSTGSEGCSCGYRYSKETNYGKYPC